MPSKSHGSKAFRRAAQVAVLGAALGLLFGCGSSRSFTPPDANSMKLEFLRKHDHRLSPEQIQLVGQLPFSSRAELTRGLDRVLRAEQSASRYGDRLQERVSARDLLGLTPEKSE